MTHIAELCCCPVGCQCDCRQFLDVTYHNIEQALHAAAKEHCPVTTDSFYKSYWNEEMSELKHCSIDTHALWVAFGRPCCGPIFRDCCARAEYRRALKAKSHLACTRIFNALHEQLLTKDNISCWKTWKNKVNEWHTVVNYVDGCTNATDIANAFATNFEQACLPNNSDHNNKLKNQFEAMFSNYSPKSVLHWISTELVDKGIREMKLGKAAGCDGIEAKHLRYAHPRICVMLSLLFNAMIIHGMVPSMFGLGITVPLIKGHNLDGSMSANYRGITLSVHLSKVFEMCVLELYGDFFVTSDLQYGF